VWCWWGWEPALGEELIFIAASGRDGLPSLCARIHTAPPPAARRVSPDHLGFTEALQHHGRLLWMPMNHFAARSTT
jgi:hypothetical protein